MPDILFILILALVIFGPKKLPEVARQVAKFLAQIRMMRDDLKRQMERELLKIELEEKQKARVARVRAERNGEAAKKALARVEAAARDGDNLMPPIVDAVRGWCTLGEISDAMRRVFGEYSPVNTV